MYDENEYMKIYHSPPLSDAIVKSLDFFMFPV